MFSGRIIRGIGGLYTVDTEQGLYQCQARGLFRKQRLSPCVGDFVDIAVVDEKTKKGYLQRLAPRKNELFRPRVANIDVAVLVFSLKTPDISFELLDRFIALVERQGLDIILCFNKIDLAGDEERKRIADIYLKIGYGAVFVSATGNAGVDELVSMMRGKAAVFAGPSGVGKSSLVNAIFQGAVMETGELSKIERGKHTTRRSEFLKLEGGGFIVDTPGFASLTTEDIPPEDLQYCFREFGQFLGQCRFSDCAHDEEPDCAVKRAIGHEISEERYRSYLKMRKGDTEDV